MTLKSALQDVKETTLAAVSGLLGKLAYLASLLARGDLRPQIGLEVSWRDLGTALAALRDRQVNGKAVLRID